MPRLLASAFVMGLVALALAVVPSSPAHAHATVVSTTPAHGTELDTAPTEVQVTFSEPVSLSGSPHAATVIDADGERVDAGDATLDDSRTILTIPLRPDLAVGAYIASWRVISADTHPVGGSIQFGYGVPASSVAGPPPPTPSAALALGVGVAKGVVYLGLVLAFGLLPAALVLGADERERRTAVRWSRIGIAVAVTGSAAQLVLQFLWILSGGGEAAAEAAAFAGSPYALATAVRIAVLVVAAIALAPWTASRATGRVRLALVSALGLGAVMTVVAAGHGGAGSWLLALATTVHAVAAIAWLGGLVQLAFVLLSGRLRARRLRRMPAWSLYAAISIGLLSASGLVQAVAQVGGAEALFETTYGGLLLAKLALVAGALTLGALGFVWVRRRQRESADGRPAPGQTARLRTRTRWEAGIVAGVVIVSGVLSSITPAKDDWMPVATAESRIGPYEVSVEVAPARRGPQSLRLTVTPPTVDSPPQELRVVLRNDRGVELPVELPYRVPQALSPGEPTDVAFISASVNVPSTGSWTIAVTVVASPVEQYAGDLTYDVR